MVKKPGKFLCCMFSLTILGVALHKIWKNTRSGYVCSCNLSIETLRLLNLCIVEEHKTKDVQGQRPCNITLGQFLYFFDVRRDS